MLRVISKILLRSRALTRNKKREKKFLPWDNIKKIALIIEKDKQLNKSLIDKFIDSSKKHVEVFYMELNSKQMSYSDWRCFSRKDRSLLLLPSKKIEEELKGKKFDAIINTCAENNLFALSVFASVNATLKCSAGDLFNMSDLIIKKNDPFNLVDYLNDTVKYLKMIRV